MSSILHYKGNRSPSVSDTIRVDGVPFDLTGSSVKFKMRNETSSVLKVDAQAIITDPNAGAVRYDWATADVDTAGEYVSWWEVTLPSGKTQDTREFGVTIAEHGLRSGDLCSIEDVRESLELGFADRARDQLIQTYITAASKAIMREYEREFAPVTVATRSFIVRNTRVVNLAPYDLQTATLVELHPEVAAPTVLTATVDYVLQPITHRDPVYTSLLLSGYLTYYGGDYGARYGLHQIDITGTWGWPSVPADVRQAAVVTVSGWLRRDFGNFNIDVIAATEARESAPDSPMNFSIPPAARRLLSPYRRSPFV